MKIFLTGATGFVGSNFLKKCLENDVTVYALRRPGSAPRVEILGDPIWVSGDLDGKYQEYLKEIDVFVHLAAHSANYPYDSISSCLYWNLNASLSLIAQARILGVKKFLIAGTCFEYGLTANQFDYIPPSAPLQPISSYPISKAIASLTFLEYAKEFNLKLQLLRIFQVYGEGEHDTRFWPSLRRAALQGDDFLMSSGVQVRDFINVKDVASKLFDALNFSEVNCGKPVIKNIGTGKGETLLEFAEYWWREWGALGDLKPDAFPARDNDLSRIVADISQAYYF